MGKLLLGTGMVLAFIVYLVTVAQLFSSGETGLALLAMFVPPADLVLAFVVSPTLGVAAIAAVAVFAIGAMVEEATP